MELPNLGESCHETSCKQLDFLPMKCDSCGNIFCRDHIHYNTHSCPDAYKKDNQVPVCPLCNNPITVMKGEVPDVVVGRHIDNDCQSDLAKKRRKIYTNRCSFKGCKQKELIPVNCDKCQKNFCLKHRHELDHECKGFEDSGRSVSKAAAAAVNRASTSNQQSTAKSKMPNTNQGRPQNTMLTYLGKDLERERRERQSQQTGPSLQTAQSGMTEDEALARAIQMSMQETEGQPPAQQKPLTRQEQEDLMLAQAIAASQQEAQAEQRRRRQQAQQNKTSCSLS